MPIGKKHENLDAVTARVKNVKENYIQFINNSINFGYIFYSPSAKYPAACRSGAKIPPIGAMGSFIPKHFHGFKSCRGFGKLCLTFRSLFSKADSANDFMQCSSSPPFSFKERRLQKEFPSVARIFCYG